MSLTDAETLKINNGRLDTKPVVFNSDLEQEVVIAQDTEDALILTSGTVKATAVQYLKLLLDSNQESTDNDDLIKEFATQQVENETALENEIQGILGSLNDFREDLVQGNRDGIFTAGFSPLMQLINQALGSIQIEFNANRFHGKFAEFAEDRFTGRLTDLDRRSIRSWIRVLLAYP